MHKTKQNTVPEPPDIHIVSCVFDCFWLDFFSTSQTKTYLKIFSPVFVFLFFFNVRHRLFYYIFVYILHKSPSFCVLRDAVRADL